MALNIMHTSDVAKLSDQLLAIIENRKPLSAFDKMVAIARAQQDQRDSSTD